MDTTTGLTIERVAIDSIQLDPANVRRHDQRSLDAIRGSLARFGQQTPIVVDQHGIVRKGNGTVAAARELGWAAIDIVRTQLTGTEAAAYSIADNRTSDLSSFDPDVLAQTLTALSDDGGLDGLGFDEQELRELIGSLNTAAAEVEDEGPEAPPAVATSRLEQT